MNNKHTLIMLASVTLAVGMGSRSLTAYGMDFAAGFHLKTKACDYLYRRIEIEGLIYKGKYSEAQHKWEAAREPITESSEALRRAKQYYLDTGDISSARTIENALLDSWTTNRIRNSSTTYRDVLTDPSVIERRRKMYFDKYGLGDEICAAYFDQKSNGFNPEIFLISEFIPQEIEIDGSTKDGIVRYPGIGFVGKNGNSEKRISEIARYVWSQRGRYRMLFRNDHDASMFLKVLYWQMDDPKLYLNELKKAETLIAYAVQEKGRPLNYDETKELMPEIKRSLEYKNFIRGRVKKVIDGDTFVLEPSLGGKEVIVRLDKIDAPELGQSFGYMAKDRLWNWINPFNITVGYSKTDRHGRILGSVYIGRDFHVNLRMVADGFAWHYTEYDTSQEFADAEANARSCGLNLWSDPSPVRPSEWRRRNVQTDSDNIKSYGM